MLLQEYFFKAIELLLSSFMYYYLFYSDIMKQLTVDLTCITIIEKKSYNKVIKLL